MRNGAIRWDKAADWFAGCEDELLRFTGSNESTQDDQFDAWSLCALGFEKMVDTQEDDFDEDAGDAEDAWYMGRRRDESSGGRSDVTGY
jgi:hypothetical protein